MDITGKFKRWYHTVIQNWRDSYSDTHGLYKNRQERRRDARKRSRF